jgi:hypothetical protein
MPEYPDHCEQRAVCLQGQLERQETETSETVMLERGALIVAWSSLSWPMLRLAGKPGWLDHEVGKCLVHGLGQATGKIGSGL